MPNICEFYVGATAPPNCLEDLRDFLKLALVHEEGFYGDVILDITKLFPDVDPKKEHGFVGLDALSEDGCFSFDNGNFSPDSVKWCRDTDSLVERLDISIEDIIEVSGRGHLYRQWRTAGTGENRAGSDFGNLYFRGAAKWGAPVPLVSRLAEKFPSIEFHVGGITEHELYEAWKCRGSDCQCIALYAFDDRKGIEKWFVRDGEELDPPEVGVRDTEE